MQYAFIIFIRAHCGGSLFLAWCFQKLFPRFSASPAGPVRPFNLLLSFLRLDKKVPVIEITGLCLPLKPQKENLYADVQQIIFTIPYANEWFLLRNVVANG